jgi:hypothetical protein
MVPNSSAHLVVSGEGDAFLEAAVRVRCPTKRPAPHLDTQSLVEILRNVGLGPALLLAVCWVDERGVLNSLPAKKPTSRSAGLV